MSKISSHVRRLLCFFLVIFILPIAVPAWEQSPFVLPEPLPELTFQDVPAGIWFYESVQVVCALELMQGVKEDTFLPGGTVSLAQGVATAVRVFERYHGLTEPEEKPAGSWYTYYVQQAMIHGILPENLWDANMNRAATRCELAAILYGALPGDLFAPINSVDTIADYTPEDLYWDAVIAMYRAGILLGDSAGCFRPDQNIRRSELAAVLARMVCPEYRMLQSQGAAEKPTGMEAFRLPDPLPELPFSDVRKGDWFYPSVQNAYALGLVTGVSHDLYSPKGAVTLGQLFAVAVRIYESYYGLEDHSGSYPGKWYDYFRFQAEYYGIVPPLLLEEDPRRTATREELAAVLYEALPPEELSPARSVESLPDYGSGDLYWEQVRGLYEAGVLNGTDEYGTFQPDSTVRRSELAALISNLVIPSRRSTAALVSLPVMERIVYGTSGAGRELVAYRYGDGEDVLVLNFAIHGFEDCYNKDGQLLVDTANALRKELETRYDELIRNAGWSVYIIPCANPDGLADGWTNYGSGRCTIYSYDAGGNLQKKGLDLNRSFPFNWSKDTSTRNYSGTAPLQAPEAKALAAFTEKVMGSGKNVLIDSHGWQRRTLVMGGQNRTLYQIFNKYFPENDHVAFSSAPGFYSAWAGYQLGYDACLFEFPGISGYNDFYNRSCNTRFIRAIVDLLANYNGAVT